TLYEPSVFKESPEGEPRPKRKLKPVSYAEEENIEDEDEGSLYPPWPQKSRRSEQPQPPTDLASSSNQKPFSNLTSSSTTPSSSAPLSSSTSTSSSALTSSSVPTTVRATSTK
ncbi:hypothetical protein BGZ76_007937, partial [Entomortierella beljakovae]